MGEARIQEDEDLVRSTLHSYCRCLDEHDLDRLIDEVYTTDAVEDRRRGELIRGHEEIRAYFARASDILEATAHLLSNIEVSVDGDQATAYSRVTAYHWTRATTHLGTARPADFVLLASYDDRLRRTERGWRISHRRLTALGPGGVAAGELPDAFRGFGGKT
ncbi:MAG TPA: nuclear transport factor 2 family protein [Jatrophihabitantaceae bacterium]